jgi:hypothetical protein
MLLLAHAPITKKSTGKECRRPWTRLALSADSRFRQARSGEWILIGLSVRNAGEKFQLLPGVANAQTFEVTMTPTILSFMASTNIFAWSSETPLSVSNPIVTGAKSVRVS